MRSMLRVAGIVAMLAAFSIGSAAAAIFYVADNGNDGTGNGQPNNPFRTFQPAVNAASDGDTIICDGPFSQTDGINIVGKSLTIICRDGVINPLTFPGLVFRGGQKDTLNVIGLTFVAPPTGNGNLLEFRRGHKETLEGVQLIGNGKGTGLVVQTVAGNSETIVNNTIISNFNTGMEINPGGSPHHLRLTDVDIHNNDIGIAHAAGTLWISGSRIGSNDTGIVTKAPLALIDNNFFANNTAISNTFPISSDGNNLFLSKLIDFTNDNFPRLTQR